MGRFHSAVDWLYGFIYTDPTNTGGRDTYIQAVALSGSTGTPVGTAGNPLITAGGIAGIPANAATYAAVIAGYAAYPTPTDMFRISGSGTKTVAVSRLAILLGATATSVLAANLDFIKRTAANTGGTPTAFAAPCQADSLDAAPTATLETYAAAPSALGAGAIFRRIINPSALAVATVAPVPYTIDGGAASSQGAPAAHLVVDLAKPVILRGAAQGLCLNFNSVALPAGFTATILCEWIEW